LKEINEPKGYHMKSRITNVLTGEILPPSRGLLPPPKTQTGLVPPPPDVPSIGNDWDDGRGGKPSKAGVRIRLSGAQPLLSSEFVQEFFQRAAPEVGYLKFVEAPGLLQIITRKPVPEDLKEKLRSIVWQGLPLQFVSN
jgi:hypothetical protein